MTALGLLIEMPVCLEQDQVASSEAAAEGLEDPVVAGSGFPAMMVDN